MKSLKFSSVRFSNKKKEIAIKYASGKLVVVHYGHLGIDQGIREIWIDKETRGKSLVIEFADGTIDYLPCDQPLYIVKDPEYMLQLHIENIIAQIKEELSKKTISKKYLARQLRTSDNQVQRLLNPNILNKNLVQLYKLASLIGLKFEMHVKTA